MDEDEDVGIFGAMRMKPVMRATRMQTRTATWTEIWIRKGVYTITEVRITLRTGTTTKDG